MANLFGKNKLKSIASAIHTEDVVEFIDIVKIWQNDYHNGSLKKDKETSREQAYNQDFFIKILGYKEKPAEPYSLEPKATTEKGQLPDIVLGYTDKSKDLKNIAAVVELKGAAIPLDRPQQRDGNMSPVQQAFKYKTQYRNCPFVIVSNFYEFRLYHDNQLDYELWTLDDLANPADDYLLFKTWYVLLHKDNLTVKSGASKTEQILSDIRVEQEEIGKKFYKVYKKARLSLLRDIYAHNVHIRKDIDTGVEKAQKIIDRIVFAAFAEDKGLLPDNTIQRVIKSADNSLFGGSLWNTLKAFFEAIDTGSEKLEIPNGYNGGLFKADQELNNLKISDEPLRTVLELSNYNFSEDLSVNILGHIFEQSISDLEEIKNKVNETNDLAAIGQSRRKKDGIFYTPDYIVRYIVENSLGIYLREHEQKFKDEFGLKDDIQDKTYAKREKQAYQKYQDFLQNIKVVDPACGSGAFLVYVFDYLMAENQRVGDILGNTIFSTDEYVKDILRNNIYGVDLNEESVEITKLSLWLKSAQKGKKLTSLDDNIKCGNSLIDDPEVAGNKAFNWHTEFAEIFKNGGFDIVVGNPPYVRAESLIKQKNFLSNHYKSYSGNADLYVYFIEHGLEILRRDGYLSYITPNKWIQSNYGIELRHYLKRFNLVEILDFGELKIFDDANTFPSIIIVSKSDGTKNFSYKEIQTLDDAKRLDSAGIEGISIDRSRLGASWQLVSTNVKILLDKLESSYESFGNVVLNLLLAGIKTGANKLFVYSEDEVSKITNGSEHEKTLFKPILFGRNFGKYTITTEKLNYVFFPYIQTDGSNVVVNLNDYPRTNIYMEQLKDEMSKRAIIKDGIRKGTHKWYELQQINKNFDYSNSSVIYPDISLENRFIFSRGSIIPDMTCFFFPADDNHLLPILNSVMFKFLAAKYCPVLGSSQKGGRIRYKSSYLSKIPFPTLNSAQIDSLVVFSDTTTKLREERIEFSRRFARLVSSHVDTTNDFSLVANWWELDFADFIAALRIKLSLQQKDELLQLFEKYRTELVKLDNQIQKTDQEINQLVYGLYGLNEKEIKLIEQGM